MNDLVGRTYIFEDGSKIEVKQIKIRDDGPWVTYHVTKGPNGVPQKLLLKYEEFSQLYRHLFN